MNTNVLNVVFVLMAITQAKLVNPVINHVKYVMANWKINVLNVLHGLILTMIYLFLACCALIITMLINLLKLAINVTVPANLAKDQIYLIVNLVIRSKLICKTINVFNV